MDIFQTEFWAIYAPQLFSKLAEHIELSMLSLGMAFAIAMPLAVLLLRISALRLPILGTANLCQTIPSLALLAFLVPLVGIGKLTAMIVLTLYGMLPILKNTYTGLSEVPKETIEAANGLGFKYWQRFWWVELPLSVPIIMAGIRTASAMIIGITTIAAFIGAGGLGDFITQGLALNDTSLILLGAIPTAILALLVDLLFAQIQTLLAPIKHLTIWQVRWRKGVLASLFIGLILPLLSQIPLTQGQPQTITIASKNFTEQYILAEIMAQLIEKETNLKVTRKFNLGTSPIVHAAMVEGDIDLYPEYTGTAYQTILNRTDSCSQQKMIEIIRQEYQQKYDLIWLPDFGFSSGQTLAVHQRTAEKHQLQSLQDLAPLAKTMKLAVPPEFLKRPDGWIALHNGYGLEFKEIKQMVPNLCFTSIRHGHVDVIQVFATDPKIQSDNLVMLKDDKGVIPSYYAAPVIRRKTLQKYPELATVLAKLIGKIDESTMRQLNGEAELQHKPIPEIARAFLEKG